MHNAFKAMLCALLLVAAMAGPAHAQEPEAPKRTRIPSPVPRTSETLTPWLR